MIGCPDGFTDFLAEFIRPAGHVGDSFILRQQCNRQEHTCPKGVSMWVGRCLIRPEA